MIKSALKQAFRSSASGPTAAKHGKQATADRDYANRTVPREQRSLAMTLDHAARCLKKSELHLGQFSDLVNGLSTSGMLETASLIAKQWRVAELAHEEVMGRAAMENDQKALSAATAMLARFEFVKGRISRTVSPYLYKGKTAVGRFRPITGDVLTHIHGQALKFEPLIRLLHSAWTITYQRGADSAPLASEVVSELRRWSHSLDPSWWQFAKHVLVVEGIWDKLADVSDDKGTTLKTHGANAADRARHPYGRSIREGFPRGGNVLGGVVDVGKEVVKNAPEELYQLLRVDKAIYDFAGYGAEAVGSTGVPGFSGYKHKPKYSVTKGLHAAVYSPKKQPMP